MRRLSTLRCQSQRHGASSVRGGWCMFGSPWCHVISGPDRGGSASPLPAHRSVVDAAVVVFAVARGVEELALGAVLGFARRFPGFVAALIEPILVSEPGVVAAFV